MTTVMDSGEDIGAIATMRRGCTSHPSSRRAVGGPSCSR